MELGERRLRAKYPERTLEEAFYTLGEVAWIRFGTRISARDWTTRTTTEQAELLRTLGATDYSLSRERSETQAGVRGAMRQFMATGGLSGHTRALRKFHRP